MPAWEREMLIRLWVESEGTSPEERAERADRERRAKRDSLAEMPAEFRRLKESSAT